MSTENSSIKNNVTGERSMSSFRVIICCAVFVTILLLSSCSSIKESPKYQFSEGIYRTRIEGLRAGKVYVDIEDDTLTIFPVVSVKEERVLDTLNSAVLPIVEEKRVASRKLSSFGKPSFDLDVLTIPFKYKPSAEDILRQLNTTFQGALYVGLRRDIFTIDYKKTQIGNYRRSFNHFGYSAGFFTGIGSSTINEFVTQGRVGYEYEGVLLLTGVAAIVGVNNYTIGLTLGVDKLLDSNRAN